MPAGQRDLAGELDELRVVAKNAGAVLRARIAFARAHVPAPPRARVHGRLLLWSHGDLRVAERLVVHGKPLPTKFTVGPEGLLDIGAGAFFNYGIDLNAQVRITIGDNIRVGPLVSVVDDDMHELVPGERFRAPIVIGDNVWIGRGAVVRPGVTIGDHAVVGANSVVTAPVPAATVVVGAPARVVRELDVPPGWRRV